MGSKIRCQRNTELLRDLSSGSGIHIQQFSDIHFRLIGEVEIDYWPSTGRAWKRDDGMSAERMHVEDVVKWASTGSKNGETVLPERRRQPWAQPDRANRFTKNPIRVQGDSRFFWSGDIPPWDDSLGEFRDFTPAEKEAGVVCRRN